MSEEIVDKPTPRSPEQTRRFRVGAVIAIVVAGGLILWLVLRDRGSSNHSSVTAATAGQIRALAASIGHPVYWVGSRQGVTYELTRQSNGTVIIRYLPQGASIGSSTPYLSVATYPFSNAYSALKGLAARKDQLSVSVPGGGVGTITRNNPNDVHVAYPGVDYQVEVFDPTAGTANSLIQTGQLVAVGRSNRGSGVAAKPTVVTLARLRSIARSVGHPVYWLGPKPKPRLIYELRRGQNGTIIIRYLPRGTHAGSSTAYTAIGTYPYPGALDALKALSKRPNVVSLTLPGGGVAVINKANPKSIHLAYPASNFEAEVFDPSATTARRYVTSGQVETVG